jgi:hypothetical protein
MRYRRLHSCFHIIQKTLGGGIMMYKRRSVRRKNATNIYITTGVMKIYRSTKKLEETQRKP